jgi:PAS domain S-box-containing protein
MDERKRLLLLILIMIAVSAVVAGATIYLLYDTALKEQSARLVETVQSQARLIEAIARFDQEHSRNNKEKAVEATISQIVEAQANYKGIGESGEFTLARRQEKHIVFILRKKYIGFDIPNVIDFNSERAEPMRLALLGKSGTVIGFDYRGEVVLAAFEPVRFLNYGLVAKIDLTEIRKPFMRAAVIAICITLIVVLVGAALFLRIINPVISHLEESENKYRTIFETTAAATIIIGGDTSILLANQEFEVLSGYPKIEIENALSWKDFVTNDDDLRRMEEYHRLRRHHPESAPSNYEFKFVNRSGQVKDVFATVSMIPNSDRSVGSFLDVSESKRTRDKIEHLNILLRSIRDINKIIVKEKDRDRLVQGICDSLVQNRGVYNAWLALINQSGEIIKTFESGIGKQFLSMSEYLEDKGLPFCGKEALQRSGIFTITEPAKECGDCPLSIGYGERESTIIRLEHKNMVFGFLTISNVSEIVEGSEEYGLFEEVAEDIAYALNNLEMEDQQKLAQKRLNESEKMAMVGKLAAGVAHSIRNPLTSVKMRLFSLERDLELNPNEKDDFDVVSNEINYIDTIIGNFLEFSRPPKLKMKEASPSDIVDLSINLLKHRLASCSVEVTVSRQQPLPKTLMDTDQFKEVLANLMINACEAMIDGGRIDINENIAPLNSSALLAQIKLSDSGPGIPETIQEKLFQPFFTTKEDGTGLGLSIARRIIQEHGGNLELESENEVGATFIITLPLNI